MLASGDSLSATMNLARWYALVHGERYTVRARADVSYNPTSGPTTTFTVIDSNTITFTS